MSGHRLILLSLTATVVFIFNHGQVRAEVQDVDGVARGEVQSCRGCSLKRLPDVRSFIYDDLRNYEGVEFHPIQGAVPHLVLFDQSDKELKRIDLSDMSRKQCNELVAKWFKLKSDSQEQVKEEL